MTIDSLTHPAGWTLRAKIVASMTALFLVVTLLTGVFTVLAGREYLSRQLQRDLFSASQRLDGPIGGGSPTLGGGGPIPGGNSNNLLRLGLSDGQVVESRSGNPLNYVVDENNDVTSLDAEQISQLENAQLGANPRRVKIEGGIGSYLLIAQTRSDGVVLITGIPTSGLDQVVSVLVWLVVCGTAAGLAAVAVGGTYLVRRNLEPLARVAATARRVSNLKLDSGDVALAERVPPEDTDPRTEVGQVGLALNSMLDNVDGALRARQESETRIRRFVADASHELRTPLASIRGYAELSRREPEPVPPSVVHALSRVESEAQRMTSLVEDLLLLARLDEGRPLARDEVDLTILAVDAVSDAHAASPDHQWELDVPDEPVVVTGDKARLHQVLGNLLANARTHTPEGTRVVTTIRPEGSMVRIAVTDNGPGIPESLQSRVFERFARGDDSRSRAAGSTGLGLSIVAAVGQAHGGRVDVTSRPGETRFSVVLPARDTRPGAAAAEPSTRPGVVNSAHVG
ncbi:Putative two component system response (putative sensor kinase) [Nostocoides japonicum T1-X7]|uniref:histidine kinase n=1 Tax=Nostocoides japonicum T1-X7 TaxID=1194083 RepID=A0A077LUC8_9MICO|nr:HAMP domain-containing sensor histidine kinase [Tetrasphaera japonica]CCH76202.1 Putative two component system response (putative sensor kinase) [Tetrasphaera japonica T1-X7]